jgi:hypothetical protein
MGRGTVWLVFIVCITVVSLASIYFRNRRVMAAKLGSLQNGEEYRRLAEMAVTAQEHNDLKLQELMQQVSHLSEQMASVQHILKEVE